MSPEFTQQLQQFYRRYPGGSVTAELVTIHGDAYVVRAIAQAGALVLATAMAADATLEAAEDQAKTRLLACLSIGDRAPEEDAGPVGLMNLPEPPIPISTSLVSTSLATAPTTAPPLEKPVEAKKSIEAPTTSLTQDVAIPGLDGATPLPVAPPPTAAEPPPEPPAPPRLRPVSSSPSDEALGATITPKDLSDILVRTSVELKRLGWQEEDGRKHLQETYGKRSRQHLTDAELVDFLHYLEQQPTPNSANS
ncbi:MAG: hypothetical protein AAF289_02610 [Cyanobacteria bacterium P01_A01_bin.135]